MGLPAPRCAPRLRSVFGFSGEEILLFARNGGGAEGEAQTTAKINEAFGAAEKDVDDEKEERGEEGEEDEGRSDEVPPLARQWKSK